MKAQAITAALPIDKRDSRRSRLLLTAALRSDAGEEVTYILNLSRTGAKLDGDTPPLIGTRVVLVRDALEAPGVVAWVERHRFGVQFDTPIEEDALIAQVEATRIHD